MSWVGVWGGGDYTDANVHADTLRLVVVDYEDAHMYIHTHTHPHPHSHAKPDRTPPSINPTTRPPLPQAGRLRAPRPALRSQQVSPSSREEGWKLACARRWPLSSRTTWRLQRSTTITRPSASATAASRPEGSRHAAVARRRGSLFLWWWGGGCEGEGGGGVWFCGRWGSECCSDARVGVRGRVAVCGCVRVFVLGGGGRCFRGACVC